MALWWAVLVDGPVRGVSADQVMEVVPAGGGLLQQVIGAQVVQPIAGGGQVGASQRGDGINVEVLAGVQGGQS